MRRLPRPQRKSADFQHNALYLDLSDESREIGNTMRTQIISSSVLQDLSAQKQPHVQSLLSHSNNKDQRNDP